MGTQQRKAADGDFLRQSRFGQQNTPEPHGEPGLDSQEAGLLTEIVALHVADR